MTRWRGLVDRGELHADPAQERAVELVDSFFDRIKSHQSEKNIVAKLTRPSASSGKVLVNYPELAEEDRVAEYTRTMAQRNREMLLKQRGRPTSPLSSVGRNDTSTAPVSKSTCPSYTSVPKSESLSEVPKSETPSSPIGPSIYLFGSVGRGKTMLLNWLHAELQQVSPRVLRIHFFDFMKLVHSSSKKSIEEIGNQIANDYDVILIDEIAISDVQDASLFPSVVQILLKRNVALAMTSNQHPQALYQNGLNRHIFLPQLLEVLRQDCRLVSLGKDGLDFRSIERKWKWTKSEKISIPLSPTRFISLDGTEDGASISCSMRQLTESELTDFDFVTTAQWLVDTGKKLRITHVDSKFEPRDVLGSARRFGKLIEVLYDRGVELELEGAIDPCEIFSELRNLEESEIEGKASSLAESAIQEALGAVRRARSRLRTVSSQTPHSDS